MIRSSYDPDNLPEIRTHEIHAGLCPFAGDLPVAEAIRGGRSFNHTLRVIGTDVHAGPWPATSALIRTAPDSVILGSVKKAEVDDALILTFFDPTGQATTATACFDEAILGRPDSAIEVDLMERPLAHSSATVQGDACTVDVPCRGIASVKVTLTR